MAAQEGKVGVVGALLEAKPQVDLTDKVPPLPVMLKDCCNVASVLVYT